MKSKVLSILALLVIVFGFSANVQQVRADDVVIATQSGATYLTTTTTISTTSAVTPVSTSFTPTTGISILSKSGNFFLPAGFFSSVSQLINNLLRIIMVISVILVFAYLVLGAMQYITSGGEKAKTEAARNKIVSAIVGLIIVASSYAILTLVLQFVGISDVNALLNGTAAAPLDTTPLTTPLPTPTPTPTSALQQLLK